MSEIAKSCDDIIKLRKEKRLPQISEKLRVIGELKQALLQLSEFRERLQRNDRALIPLAEKAPGVVETIKGLNLASLIGTSGDRENFGAIGRLEEEMKRLEKRFSRDRIQIALVGRARKGKSTFLQSVSGLTDDVIPTSSYTDCTGAVSVIENCDGPFRMEIDFYSEKEFIRFVNSSLDKFGLTSLSVNDLNGIRALHGNTILSEHANEEVRVFYKEYFDNPEPYLQLIGLPTKEFTSTESVIEYVAKYKMIRNGETIPPHYSSCSQEATGSHTIVYFNKYIAVKEAHIWQKYPFDEAGKIVMLDTIGLGNENTKDKDEATMYKVLQEDTDAAIYNFLVPSDGMSTRPADEISTLNGIFSKLETLNPEQWFVININTYTPEKFNNSTQFDVYDKLCDKILSEMRKTKFGNNEENKHVALFTERVSNNVPDDVRNKIMIRLLKAVGDNISALDEVFMSRAEEMATEIYNIYGDVCNRIARAFDNIVAQSPSFLSTFNANFNSLRLRVHLDEYVNELNKKRDEVCDEIVNELKPQLAELTSFVPELKEIETKLLGMNAHHIQNIYFEISDHVTARITSHLKEVSAKAISDVEDSVKIKIARLLHDSGKLDKLNLKSGSLTDDSKAIGWLASLSRERLSGYPELEDAVNAVVNFRMNIEGYIYAECIKACENLNDRDITFPPNNESVSTKANFIWNTILQKVIALRDNLRERFGIRKGLSLGTDNLISELAKPSLLIWCVADSFRKQFLYINNGDDLKNFYCEYAPVIWRDEIQLQEDIREATDSVKKLMNTLKSQNDRRLF